jgi:hypothetical protein
MLDMKRDTRVTIGFVVAAVLILAAKLFFLWAPDAAATTEGLETIPQQQGTFVVIETHRGLQDWQGSIGGSDFTIASRDGSGDEIIPITCETGPYNLGIYSVAIQKQEEEGTLIVGVVQDGKVLKQASTSSDFGVVSVAGNC